MHELNIQTMCRNQSRKGRVERAHLTLQDRLVKELRLQGICSMEAANDFAEAYMADYNRRLAKYRDMILTYTVWQNMMILSLFSLA
jgi:hypothetical protein